MQQAASSVPLWRGTGEPRGAQEPMHVRKSIVGHGSEVRGLPLPPCRGPRSGPKPARRTGLGEESSVTLRMLEQLGRPAR